MKKVFENNKHYFSSDQFIPTKNGVTKSFPHNILTGKNIYLVIKPDLGLANFLPK